MAVLPISLRGDLGLERRVSCKRAWLRRITGRSMLLDWRSTPFKFDRLCAIPSSPSEGSDWHDSWAGLGIVRFSSLKTRRRQPHERQQSFCSSLFVTNYDPIIDRGRGRRH
jgi:hypothetical protein